MFLSFKTNSSGVGFIEREKKKKKKKKKTYPPDQNIRSSSRLLLAFYAHCYSHSQYSRDY